MDLAMNRTLDVAQASLRGTADIEAAQRRAHAVKARDEARETAQQFEQMLVQELVSSFRESTSIAEDGGMFGSGPGSAQYAAMFDEKLATAVTRGGQVGIADRLMVDLERWHQIPTAAEAGETADTVNTDGLRPLRGGLDAYA